MSREDPILESILRKGAEGVEPTENREEFWRSVFENLAPSLYPKRPRTYLDAVGGSGCKATTETMHPEKPDL